MGVDQRLLTRLYNAARDYFLLVETGVCDKDSDDIYNEFAAALVETRIIGGIDDENVYEVLSGEFSSHGRLQKSIWDRVNGHTFK